MMLLSYTIIDFHLFYDGAVDIQIWALLTRCQCKISDAQVILKACGPLVFLIDLQIKPLFLFEKPQKILKKGPYFLIIFP